MENTPSSRISDNIVDKLEALPLIGTYTAQQQSFKSICLNELRQHYEEHCRGHSVSYAKSVVLARSIYASSKSSDDTALLSPGDIAIIVKVAQDRHPILPSPSLASLVLMKNVTHDIILAKLRTMKQSDPKLDLTMNKQIQEIIRLILIHDKSELILLFAPLYDLETYEDKPLLHSCILYKAIACFEEVLRTYPETADQEDSLGRSILQACLEYKTCTNLICEKDKKTNCIMIKCSYLLLNKLLSTKREAMALKASSFFRPTDSFEFIPLFSALKINSNCISERIAIILLQKLFVFLQSSGNLNNWPKQMKSDLLQYIFSLEANINADIIHENIPSLCRLTELIANSAKYLFCPFVHQCVDNYDLYAHFMDMKHTLGQQSHPNKSCSICVCLKYLKSCLHLCYIIDRMGETLHSGSLARQGEDKSESATAVDMTQNNENIVKIGGTVRNICCTMLTCFFKAMHLGDKSIHLPTLFFTPDQYTKRCLIVLVQSFSDLVMRRPNFLEKAPLCCNFLSVITGMVVPFNWYHKLKAFSRGLFTSDMEVMEYQEYRKLFREQSERVSFERDFFAFIEGRKVLPSLRCICRWVILRGIPPDVSPFTAVDQMGLPNSLKHYMLYKNTSQCLT